LAVIDENPLVGSGCKSVSGKALQTSDSLYVIGDGQWRVLAGRFVKVSYATVLGSHENAVSYLGDVEVGLFAGPPTFQVDDASVGDNPFVVVLVFVYPVEGLSLQDAFALFEELYPFRGLVIAVIYAGHVPFIHTQQP